MNTDARFSAVKATHIPTKCNVKLVEKVGKRYNWVTKLRIPIDHDVVELDTSKDWHGLYGLPDPTWDPIVLHIANGAIGQELCFRLLSEAVQITCADATVSVINITNEMTVLKFTGTKWEVIWPTSPVETEA